MDQTQKKMASSFSSHRCRNFDVFISFRGEDTRKTFVSHLERGFSNRGILTFKDDRKLEPGDSITDELCRAIRTTRFAVVVISENYATSSWCLDELELIMKEEIEVVPIFYEVKPSDVRYQKGKFALKKYQGSKMANKVSRWKKALTGIANRSGKESLKCVDDATMIEEIVQSISSRLLSKLPIDFRNFVGMKAHMDVLIPLLDMDSKDDARIIGISGTGGIGKTTIAKYLYEQLKLEFSPHHCFMGNVAKVSREHDLLHLQRQLLFNIFREENLKLESVEHGRQQLEFRLKHVKVLLVLDDVDDARQINALAKDVRWFGPGSRIIITTRDKSLLDSCEVYDVKYLDDDQALQLFQQIAFEGRQPPSHAYTELSSLAYRLAQGLPLALEALGSSLRSKSISEWKKALRSFKETPYKIINRILNISYDSLDELSKTALLHIECLFNGEPVSRIKNLLDRGELGGELVINVLAEKSLIDISANGCMTLPHLLDHTGKDILHLHQESRKSPSEQRILSHFNIRRVLADKTGTTRFEGVVLDVSKMPYDFHIEWKLFKEMENLNFLKIYNYKRYESLDYRRQSNLKGMLLLPHKLKLLHWDAYPFTSLPSSINPDSLVEVNLCHSKLKTLWNGAPPRLSHLKRLNLTGSKDLQELPDLQESTYLEELMLGNCISLRLIPESICSLPRLQKLDLSNCDGLKNLKLVIKESEPTFFENRRSLHVRSVYIDFTDVEPSSVKESQGNSLANLSVKGHLRIQFKVLEGYAEHVFFVSEKQITLEQETDRLKSPPYGFKLLHIAKFNCTDHKVDPFMCYSFSDFPWLLELNLINLNIEEIPDDIHYMRALEKLNLSGNDFKCLPASMVHLSSLRHLWLCNCRRLEALPSLYQLETLTLSDCTNLQALVNLSHEEQDHSGEYSLLELRLDNCNNVESLSDQLSLFTKLTYLYIRRHDFETLPTSIKNLSSLITLCLDHCKKLRSLTELPLSLKYLHSHGCKSLKSFSLSINHSVDHLDLNPCFQWKPSSNQIDCNLDERRSGEVPVCASLQKPKILSTYNEGTRSIRSITMQGLNSKAMKLMAFAMCTGVLVCCRRWSIARK